MHPPTTPLTPLTPLAHPSRFAFAGCYTGFDFLSAEVTDSPSTTNKGYQCGTTDDASQLLKDLFVPNQQIVNCGSNNCTFTIAIVDYPNLVRCEQGGTVSGVEWLLRPCTIAPLLTPSLTRAL